MRDGRQAVIEQLVADGVRYMFGNPGTVEQGFLNTMREYSGKIDYIFALQESIAVAAADGYARASGKLGVIQLHSGVGLGNGIGNLYQAFRGHSPLLVIAGDAGVRYDAMDAQMASDLVAIARPITKYATRVTHRESVLRVLRRAIKMALTPPFGPVFVDLPMDVLDESNNEETRPSCHLITRSSPPENVVRQIAEALQGAMRPMIIMGDGVACSAAQGELDRVANLLGAEVWGANSAEVNISAASPLYGGSLGHMFGFDSVAHIRTADAVLIIGTYVFPEVFPDLRESDVFLPTARIIHIDLDAYEIAKNYRVDIGVVADPKESLGRLAVALNSMMSPGERNAADARTAVLAARQRDADLAAKAKDTASDDHSPPPMGIFARELAKRLPAGAMVFDEALTCSPDLTRYIVAETPGTYFQTRGGSLGLGIPGAIGMKLARPECTVFGFTGDGGSLYTIQALWTAAHHKVGAKFVICNNHSYRLLKWNLDEYRKERNDLSTGYPESFDIQDPNIEFTVVAKGFGVEAERVETADQIHSAITRALGNDRPYLIELAVAP
jgi:thiamine pyrophosphate-dependent acetolactate synthase large subunit-like protein